MRVIRSSVHTQLLSHSASHFGLRQHSSDCALQNSFWMFGEHLLGAGFLQAAWPPGVGPVNFVFNLSAGKHHFFSIYNDNVVPDINVGRISRLVLSHQKSRSPRCQAAYCLSASIDQVPFSVLLGILATWYKRIHFSDISRFACLTPTG